MANRQITALASLTAPATGDVLPIIDISEALAANKNKKITYGELLSSAPSGTPAAPSFSFDGDPNSGLYSAGADQVAISTNGTGRLFVDASGNVALGTATFSKPFTIINQNAAISLRANSSGTYSDQGIFFAVDGTNYAQIYNSDIGQLIFRTGSGLSERLRITSAGRVGIGTTSPSVKLEVSGAANANEIRSVDGTINSQWYQDQNGYSVFGTFSNHPQVFRTNAVERVRLDTSGRLLVGTSTTGLQNTRSMLWQGSGEATLYINHSTSDISGDPFVKFGWNAGQIGSITQSGTTAVAYNTSSDYRLKENVTPVTDGITRLQQLNPSRFNFIADPAKTVDGFIAHEVQAVVPEAITGEKDAEDDDGNPVYQGIDQSKLVPLLTAALQEAIAKIESLEARLTAAGIE